MFESGGIAFFTRAPVEFDTFVNLRAIGRVVFHGSLNLMVLQV